MGGSIEDFDPEGGIHDVDRAVARVAAAAETARRLGFAFTLTARAENHIRGNPDLDDTIARLHAYERAGADVLYAPGLRDADEIRAVCQATSRPVNVRARPTCRSTRSSPLERGAQEGHARRAAGAGLVADDALGGRQANALARRIRRA